MKEEGNPGIPKRTMFGKRKGFTVEDLPNLAILLVIAAIAIAIGANVLDDTQETICDYSWVNLDSSFVGVNQITGTYAGCCYAVNSTNTSDCAVWAYNQTALNTTMEGLESMETLSDWLPLIALIVAAAIIIGILVTYLVVR